jgi:hypothetical protein
MGNEVTEVRIGSEGGRDGHLQQGAIAQRGETFNLTPRNLNEAMQLAELLASSEYVPKDYRGKPGNVLVAVQWGHEIGLKPLQAMQNLSVINGRPSLWGDAMIALVRNSPLCEYIVETEDAAGTAFCQVKRRGEVEQVRKFSDADAKKADLLGKAGPWSTSPKRMKQMRARAFALRDVFADVLKGMAMAEEVMDLPAEGTAPTPLDQLAGAAPAVPKELLDAAQKAAGDGRDAFAAWFKDKQNGGQTTKVERELLKFSLDDLKGIALRADEKRAEAAASTTAAAASGEQVVINPNTTSSASEGPTFGDDSLGGQA